MNYYFYYQNSNFFMLIIIFQIFLQQLAKLLLQLVTSSEKKNILYFLANIVLCTGTINYAKKSKVKYLYLLYSREIFNCILDFITRSIFRTK